MGVQGDRVLLGSVWVLGVCVIEGAVLEHTGLRIFEEPERVPVS